MVCCRVPMALLDLRLDSPPNFSPEWGLSPLKTPQGSCLQDALLPSLWRVLGPQSHEHWPFAGDREAAGKEGDSLWLETWVGCLALLVNDMSCGLGGTSLFLSEMHFLIDTMTVF